MKRYTGHEILKQRCDAQILKSKRTSKSNPSPRVTSVVSVMLVLLILAKVSVLSNCSIANAGASTNLSQFVISERSNSPVTQIAFSPDSKKLVSLAIDGTAEVWSIEDAMETGVLADGNSHLASITFAPPSTLVVAGLSDGTVEWWSCSGTRLGTIATGLSGPIISLKYTSDGTVLVCATAFEFSVLKCYSGIPNRRVGQPQLNENSMPFGAIAVSPSNGLMAYGPSCSGIAEMPPIKEYPTRAFLALDNLKRSETSRWVFTSVNIHTLNDERHEDILRSAQILGPIRSITGLSISPDGDCLVSASDDFTLRFWSTKTRACVSVIRGAQPFTSCLWSPDGRYVAATMMSTGTGTASTAGLYSARSSTLVQKLVGKISVSMTQPMQFSATGRYLFAIKSNETPGYGIIAWRMRDGRSVTLPTVTVVNCIATSPDGAYLADGQSDGTVELRIMDRWTPISLSSGAPQSATETSALTSKSNIPWNFVTDQPLYPMLSPNGVLGYITDESMDFVENSKGEVICWDRNTLCKVFAFRASVNNREIPLYVNDHVPISYMATTLMLQSPPGHDRNVNDGLHPTPLVTEYRYGTDGMVLASIADPFNRMAIVVPHTRLLDIVDTRCKRLVRSIELQKGTLVAMGLFCSSRDVYVLYLDGTGLTSNLQTWSIATGKQTGSYAVPDTSPIIAASSKSATIAIGLSGKAMIVRVGMQDPTVIYLGKVFFAPGVTGNDIPQIETPNSSVQEFIAEMPRPCIALSPDGSKLAALDSDGSYLLSETNTGRTLCVAGTAPPSSYVPFYNSHNLPLDWDKYLQFSPDGTKIIVGDLYGHPVIRNAAYPYAILHHLDDNGPVYPEEFLGDGTELMMSVDNSHNSLWRLSSGSKLCSLYISDANNWYVMFPDGRVDGSPYGMQNCALFRNGQFQTFRTAFLNAFVPGELESVVDSLSSPDPLAIALREKSTPHITVHTSLAIVARPGTVPVHVRVSGVNVRSVLSTVVFDNTRLVIVDRQPYLSSTKTIPINLSSGVHNLEVFVRTAAGKWSNDAATRIEVDGGHPSGTLFAVVVAVPDFAGTAVLPHANSDAEAIANTLRTRTSQCYQHIDVTELTENSGTKKAIFNVIESIQQRASPDDAFLFYFTGHSIPQLNEPPELSTSCTSVINPPSISYHDLAEWSSNLHALRQLWILDTCSGTQLTLAEHRSVPSSWYNTYRFGSGVYFLTATNVGDFDDAYEQPTGSGALTRAVLEALTGSVRQDSAGTVDALRVCQYAQEAVPEETANYIKQYPQLLSSPEATYLAFPLAP
jgi:WD40 repeat protein